MQPKPFSNKLTLPLSLALPVSLALGLTATLPGCETTTQVQEQQAAADQAAEEYQDQAAAYYEVGALDAALAMFGMALEENPNLADAHIGMSDIYREQDNYPFMARAAARAVRVDPNSYKGYYNLGFARQMLGNIDEAIASYLRALTIKPDSLEANREVASAYIQQGSAGQALTYAEKAVELEDDSQGAWANLGFVYGQLGQYQQAIEAYRKAADRGELSPPILLGLGDAYIHLGQFKLAENTLRQLSGRFPSSTAYERQALAVFKQSRFDEALLLYNQAIELDPADAAAHNGAGACLMTQYIQSGRDNRALHAEAMEHWRKSIRLQSNQPRIIELLSQFQNI